MTAQLVVEEIMSGAHVEVILAKHIGLSLTKRDVLFVKKALKAKDEKQIDLAVRTILQKHTKSKIPPWT